MRTQASEVRSRQPNSASILPLILVVQIEMLIPYLLEKGLLLRDIDGLELPFLTPGLESEEVADTLFLVN